MTIATAAGRTLQCLLDDEIEPFLQQLRAAGYADESVRRSGPSRENLCTGHSNT